MKYLKVLTDFAKSIEKLSDAETGRLFRAMLSYADVGEEPTLNGNERFVWPVAKENIDKQADKYNARCEVNKKNASMRWDANGCESHRIAASRTESQREEKGEEREVPPTPPIEKEVSKRKPNNNIFKPPTIEDVREYCLQQGYKLDAERFVDYYISNGWMVGKNKMKDWKAAVRTWVRKGKSEEKRTYTFADVYAEKGEGFDETGSFPNFDYYSG